MLTSKKKHLSVNYRPLKASVSLVCLTSVPDRQMYRASDKSFLPDYTLTPLTLLPRCSAIDIDKPDTPELINEQLTNLKWYERIGGQLKLIESGSSYVITGDGAEKGKLQMKKNSSITNPITLEFSAEYVDSRTGQILKFTASHVVVVSDSTSPAPVLTIDAPQTVVWTPYRDVLQQTLTANLMVGNENLTNDPRVRFHWYRLLETGSLEAITDGNGDNDWEVVSVDHNVLVIDRDFIGHEQTYLCKAVYREDGNLPAEPDDSDPVRSTRIVRYIPKLECDFKGLISGCPDGTTHIYPQAYVYDSRGAVSNAEEYFRFIWYGKKPSESLYKVVAEGPNPTIPFVEGMMLDLQVEDKGPQALIVDDENPDIYCTDEEGLPLYQRINEKSL